MSVRLELRTEIGLRTTWWAPSEGYHPGEPVWWLVHDYGAVRPATDIEIELWQQILATRARALVAVRPFSELVYLHSAGGTPEEALRKEFGS